MAKSLKELKARAREFDAVLPCMEGREKGEFDNLIGETVTIREFDFMEIESDCFVVFNCDEHKEFFFGGKVLTERMKELEADGFTEAIQKEGLPTKFGQKKSRNKRAYTTVEFFPEA